MKKLDVLMMEISMDYHVSIFKVGHQFKRAYAATFVNVGNSDTDWIDNYAVDCTRKYFKRVSRPLQEQYLKMRF